ncbi:MAG: large repetitive protein, partial [Betaproteobacteria bacterium]|nr:large repetitive protein [Betaproteobacteria bacterium]
WFFGPGALSVGSHTFEARIRDTAGNAGSVLSKTVTIENNTTPQTTSSSSGLLSLLGVDLLSLVALNGQAFTASDYDNNIASVNIQMSALVSLLTVPTVTVSSALASELGITLSGNGGNNLTLSVASGAIDSMALNELLGTATTTAGTGLLGVTVLPNVTVSATDTNGLSGSSSTSSLAAISLTGTGSPGVYLGGSGNDLLDQSLSATSVRLYGLGGNDTLKGGLGDDLLRGGAGVDSLQAGAGEDLLIYDANDSTVDGGAGTDVLRLETSAVNLSGNTHKVTNIERIDLGAGTANRAITLTIDEAGVLKLTGGATTLRITGDGADTVNLASATFVRQELLDGHSFNVYTLGSTTIKIEDPIVVMT